MKNDRTIVGIRQSCYDRINQGSNEHGTWVYVLNALLACGEVVELNRDKVREASGLERLTEKGALRTCMGKDADLFR